jgi:ribonuclease P/MRP protein subunit POP8
MFKTASEHHKMPAIVETEVQLEGDEVVEKPISKKRSKPHFKGHEIQSRTIKTPPWTYIHLNLISSDDVSSSQQSLDLLTARSYLTSALAQFLGLSGSAIPIDFLKLEDDKTGIMGDVWVRVPREDAGVVLAAVGGWSNGNGTGWKVQSWGNWLGAVHGGSTTASIWNS